MDARTDLKFRRGSRVSCSARTAGSPASAVRTTGLLFLHPTGPMLTLVMNVESVASPAPIVQPSLSASVPARLLCSRSVACLRVVWVSTLFSQNLETGGAMQSCSRVDQSLHPVRRCCSSGLALSSDVAPFAAFLGAGWAKPKILWSTGSGWLYCTGHSAAACHVLLSVMVRGSRPRSSRTLLGVMTVPSTLSSISPSSHTM
eukprot:3932197-Rhodomonas_salina.1